jgi:hypothetical protein
MNNNKALTDIQIMESILKALELTANGFSKELGYKSSMSLYNILDGNRPIPEPMVNKIRLKFPEVSIHYIDTGLGTPLKADFLTKKVEQNPFKELINRIGRIETTQLKILELLQN